MNTQDGQTISIPLGSLIMDPTPKDGRQEFKI